jgi:hypothetical protein
LITRDTVLIPTPANAATSRIVARVRLDTIGGGADIDVSFATSSVQVQKLLDYKG